MVVAIGLWSVAVTPGEPTVIVPEADIQITNVALGDKIEENSRGTLKLTYLHASSRESDDEESEDEEKENDEEEEPKMQTTALCSLTPGSIEQASINVILEEGQEFLFELVGKNTLYLTGNYIDQTPPTDLPPFGDSDDEDEDDYDLRSVGSDVEVPMDGLESDASRFEEVEEKASGKRPRTSDAMETEEPKPVSEKKAKKQKGTNGEAIPVAAAEEKPLTKKEKKQKAKEAKEGEEKKETTEKKKADATPKKAAGEEKELSGGVQTKDSKVGTGPMAKAGNTVGMRYIGKLQNGKVFDKNVKGKPFTFQLGAGEVIKGWDVGIAGMQVGGERLLTIPPGMAYGKKKSGDIPANSTLIFEVKLLEIK